MKKSVPLYLKRAGAILCTLLVAIFQPVASANPIFTKVVASAADKTADEEQPDSTAISLNATNANVIIDDTYTLRVYNTYAEQTIVCKSSDSKIISVKASDKNSSAFVLKGKKCGTAEVTVRIKEGLSTITTLKCDVTVGLPAISVSFTRAKIKLAVNGRTSLKTILKPSDTVEEPTYVSSDTDIAYISKKGTVIAKAIGECTITAYIKKKDDNGNYICDTCKITVSEEDIEVTEEDIQ